jgi:ribosomal protein S12 methylthiotransferase
VPEEIKQERLQRFMAHQAEISTKRLQLRVGKTETVLIDEVVEEGAVARSKSDAPEIDGQVFIDGATHLKVGDFVDVKLEEADDYDLWGHLV